MKPSAVALSVLFGIAALIGIVWVGRYPELKSAIPGSSPELQGPPISETGPYPKAVTENTEFNFGEMAWQSKGTHTFTIRNEGEADLLLAKGVMTCNCTGADLDSDKPIPPGQSTEVTLHWTVKQRSEEFRHSATILTNDPKNKSIKFEITGKVVEQISVQPEGVWELGTLSAKSPSEASGLVFSKILDDFTIEEVKAKSSFVTATFEKMTPEQAAEMNARSAYRIKAVVSGAPIGAFSETLTITTSVEDHKTIEVRLNGTHPGPVEVFGPGYESRANLLLMGEFPAKDGKEATLTMFFRDFDDEVKLLKSEQTHNSVEVDFSPVATKPGAKRRYLLKIKVPPGPPQDRQHKNSEKLDLFFNHPEAEHVKLSVSFLAVNQDQ